MARPERGLSGEEGVGRSSVEVRAWLEMLELVHTSGAGFAWEGAGAGAGVQRGAAAAGSSREGRGRDGQRLELDVKARVADSTRDGLVRVSVYFRLAVGGAEVDCVGAAAVRRVPEARNWCFET